MVEIEPHAVRRKALEASLAERTGARAQAGAALATVEHVFTHRKLTLEIYDITHFEGEITPNWYINARWLSAHEMGEIARSRLTDKVLSAVGYDTP